MLPPTNFRVIGVRADGTIAVHLPSENLKKAKFLARRLQIQHADWKVKIDIPAPAPAKAPPRSPTKPR